MTIRSGIDILADTKMPSTHTLARTLAHLIAHFGRMCETYMNSPWCKVFHQISKIIDRYFFHVVVVVMMLMSMLMLLPLPMLPILLRTLNGRNGAHKTKYKYFSYVCVCVCVWVCIGSRAKRRKTKMMFAFVSSCVWPGNSRGPKAQLYTSHTHTLSSPWHAT